MKKRSKSKKRSSPSARPGSRRSSLGKRGASSPPQSPLPGNNLHVVFSPAEIEKRVRELAGQLNRDYQGKTLHVVGILENCFMFMADLVRSLKVLTICYFVRGEIRDATSGGVSVREIKYVPQVDVAGKDVLLLDGILQSGVTLDHLYRSMLGRSANSVRTATLIEKVDERKVDVPTDYVGFKTTEGFLVGYGLGYQDRYRNLPCVASMG